MIVIACSCIIYTFPVRQLLLNDFEKGYIQMGVVTHILMSLGATFWTIFIGHPQ